MTECLFVTDYRLKDIVMEEIQIREGQSEGVDQIKRWWVQVYVQMERMNEYELLNL